MFFSCSSSEASDDEEGKRLSILGSKYCGRKRDGDNDPDDRTGGQGVFSSFRENIIFFVNKKNERVAGGVGGGTGGDNEAGGSTTSHCGPSPHSGGESVNERRLASKKTVCVPAVNIPCSWFRSGGAVEGCTPTGQQHLFPIPEMTHLDSGREDCLRAKLLHRLVLSHVLLACFYGLYII